MPTQERVRELFYYHDGELYNRTSRNNAPKGSKVGFWNESYFKCNIDMKRMPLHRAIWIWHSGAIPDGLHIDHIDRDRRNNHIENLRLVTPKQNMLNKTKYPRHKRAVPLGISFAVFEKKWRAAVPLPNGKRLFIATSHDKYRVIWLMHLYRKGLYHPGATIESEAPLTGGEDAISRLRANQSRDDLSVSLSEIRADLETWGVELLERPVPTL